MSCAWNELLQILPQRIRPEVDRLGKQNMQELRLRVGQAPWMVMANGQCPLSGKVTVDELSYVLHVASRYSPWSAATSAFGYITAKGGHRIGICGTAVVKDGAVCGIRDPVSLCIRVARDIAGIGAKAAAIKGNILILGPPGCGKTTLLRDLIRHKASNGEGPVAVIDERDEIFPTAYNLVPHIDVLRCCSKTQGVSMVLKTMGPRIIAVDEITDTSDCTALMETAWCGVNVIATAHGRDLADLRGRNVYKPIVNSQLFDHAVVLKMDKTYEIQRVNI